MDKKTDIPEAKSLRWLVANFPRIPEPDNDADRMCNAIHIYAEAGAKKIEALAKEVDELKSKLAILEKGVM